MPDPEIEVVENDRYAATSFIALIASLEGRVTAQDLTEAVQGIVSGLHDTMQALGGKPKGSMTVKLNFKLDDGMVEVVPEFSTKLPKIPRSKTLFWATPNNMLTLRNPKQREMFADPVNGPRPVPSMAHRGVG